MEKFVDVIAWWAMLGCGLLIVVASPWIAAEEGALPAVVLAPAGVGMFLAGVGMLVPERRAVRVAGVGFVTVAVPILLLGLVALAVPGLIIETGSVGAGRFPIPQNPTEARLVALALIVYAVIFGAVGRAIIRSPGHLGRG